MYFENNVLMAKYTPIDLISTLSGKVCQHSEFYLANRGKTKYSGRRCNPRDLTKNPYSETELRIQQKYKQTVEALKTLTPEQIQSYREKWIAQKNSKYSTLRGFMFSQEYAKLND